jgi:MFS superfamily sulfate permease-like transporter
MMRKVMKKEFIFREILSSWVVTLVALPLCLGIALASGVSPMAGLLSGIIGGVVVGIFSGAPLQVSGPAAGLVVMVVEIIRTHGLQGLGVICFLSGLFQMLAAFLKLGPYFRATSPALVKGMLTGIGDHFSQSNSDHV